MRSKQPESDPVIQSAYLYLEAVRRLDLKMVWLMLSVASQAFLKGVFYERGQLAREKLSYCTHEDLQQPLETMLIEHKAKIEDIFDNTSVPTKPIYEDSCHAIVRLGDIKAQVPVYFIRPTAVPSHYFIHFVKDTAETEKGDFEIWRVDFPRMLAESNTSS